MPSTTRPSLIYNLPVQNSLRILPSQPMDRSAFSALRRFTPLLLLLASGCASYGVVQNAPEEHVARAQGYSIATWAMQHKGGDINLVLAFSGGGTRAAALSYGVLKALRDTPFVIDGRSKRLLDEVDWITSVSGGSFTAAYYGLHGERIFDDYEDAFLRRDVDSALIRGVLNPLEWFARTGRTELAVQYYEDYVFHNATFGDMKRDGPMVVINTSDLGYGVRFSFVQEYFNLLCSDLSTFRVARAVAASSAVPVLFNPVVVRNYADCGSAIPAWLTELEKREADDPRLAQMAAGVKTYFDKERRKYAHFVDGGITDNLGLRAIYDVVEAAGGPRSYLEKMHRAPPRQLVVIVVNASTEPRPNMDASNEQPGIIETINAMTDTQLHRYNVATFALMREVLAGWAKAVSTPERPVSHHLIELSFEQLASAKEREYFNAIPTTFSLSGEQVDRLVAAGGTLLRNNPDFRRLMNDLQQSR